MNKNSKIFVAGHRGLVGSALVRVLRASGFENILTISRGDVDLTDPVAVKWWFSCHEPEYVFLAAAKVGGLIANTRQSAEFLLENLRIQDNVICNARAYGAKKLLFLGSACAYPKFAENPIKESSLLTGELEPSNECYALAKIAGIRLCQALNKQYGCNFISAMPTNLYGVGDHYDLTHSHVIPGMIRRFHEAKTSGAKECWLWGTGNPIREFLFSDDLAEACVLLMESYDDPGLINISSGQPVMLRSLACEIRDVVGYGGDIGWDSNKPDGTPNRQQDIHKIKALGWSSRVSLREGLAITYQDFLCQQPS